ncbi:LPXTG cell wall anchor domain-containing protein [Agathobacter sp.]|uniref:LPXTG cell wall anchor domain-containing protein n=1 Tax=Agathobacter sp. TaxID=2021311 RepID=UPI002A917D17|nr:LPXTG cell wall anchor domain-containing protein [Agathobacter sp.]MDY5863207.1 LPXTG cell wall anchor domain-containing protein [Agathobacter sp.]
MRKLVTFMLAAVTALSMTCTVFAAPSPTSIGAVSTTGSTATDANGKAITATVAETTQKPDTAVVESTKLDNATIIGSVDISLPAGTAFPATVTVKVAGVTANTKLVVLHYVDGAWKTENSKCGDGTVTISGLNSCSPFAFVADKTTVTTTTNGTSNGAANGTNGTASPKTGETAAMPMVALIGVLAMAGVVLVSKKSRA